MFFYCLEAIFAKLEVFGLAVAGPKIFILFLWIPDYCLISLIVKVSLLVAVGLASSDSSSSSSISSSTNEPMPASGLLSSTFYVDAYWVLL